MVAALLVLLFVSAVSAGYPYKTYYFDQYLDHFNIKDTRTFKARYLVTNEFYIPTKSANVMFFYTGNEGAIEGFFENSGFVFEFAKDLGALVVFAEHRYYGSSMPFNNSFSLENVGYLSIEQALADYAVLISYLKTSYKLTTVVAFGGSYGGMLSAYMRFKYPNVVDAALAASAPIYLTAGEAASGGFFEVVTKDFASVNSRCPTIVRDAFREVLTLAKQGQKGLKQITESFQLCQPLNASRVEHLIKWVQNSFGSMCMGDYPYPASFLASLPAYPVNVSCKILLENEGKDKMRGLAQAAGLFYNGTGGSLKCFDIEKEYIECADPTGCGLGPSSLAWDYQVCSEVYLNIDTNNVTDMFPPNTFDPTPHCTGKWSVQKRKGWMPISLWGKDIRSSSNIIFSNGKLDPWSSGGVPYSLSNTLVAILIEGGAHHLDLRGSNPRDPPSVVAARLREKQLISTWIGL